jgi:5'-methylthioadenosine phosphorylase
MFAFSSFGFRHSSFIRISGFGLLVYPPTVFPNSAVPLAAMDQLKVGVIGGSGLGNLLGDHAHAKRHEVDTPFGRASDAILETEWAGVPVFLLARHGPGHVLNPSQVPYRANLFALKELGCTHVLASGAVGSLREEFKPRDLVVPDQVIDKTSKRAGTFYENAAVHVEFAEPFCGVLRHIIVEASAIQPATDNPQPATHSIHKDACYVAMEGPAFSTRAESLMHRLWGGDLIGMTAMPEAKLAREAELSYALIALVTDYDCWRQKPANTAAGDATAAVNPDILLKEIIGNLQAASANAMALIRKTIELLGQQKEKAMAAPSRQSLKLAIWSDKTKIVHEEIAKLKPLWGRYFL